MGEVFMVNGTTQLVGEIQLAEEGTEVNKVLEICADVKDGKFEMAALEKGLPLPYAKPIENCPRYAAGNLTHWDTNHMDCVSKFEKTPLYDNQSTYIYCSAIRSFKDENIINGGIAVIFDSTPQFKAMLDETLPIDVEGNKIPGVFGIFTDKNKQIISSTNENFPVDSFLNIDDNQ